MGVITLGGTLFLHSFGTDNTFVGASAGNITMTGTGNNTAVGTYALTANTTGPYNGAFGGGTITAANTAAGSGLMATPPSGRRT